MKKYYFINATGVRYVSAQSVVGDDVDKLENAPGVVNIDGKPHIPIETIFTTVLESDRGFIPSMFCDYLAKSTKSNRCVLNFVQEMTAEEYVQELAYKKSVNEPAPLNNNIISEIDDLISSVEKGTINVYKPEKPDYPKSQDQKKLMDLGLPGDLFEDPFKEGE